MVHHIFGICRPYSKARANYNTDTTITAVSVVHFIKQQRAHQVANMDKSPIQFDIPLNRTVRKAGEKTVKIETTGNEKNHLTVVLTCAGGDSKLKPLVIFKRKTQNCKQTWCVACSPAWWILYHVTARCKGPI